MYGPIQKASFLQMRKLIDVNIISSLGLIRFFVPRMIERRKKNKSGGGRIVLVSSINSAAFGANIACYAASKAFLTSLAQVNCSLDGSFDEEDCYRYIHTYSH